MKQPVYIEIYEFYKAKILNNELKYGVFLPTENELQEMFFSSRVTVRKAMNKLKEDLDLIARSRPFFP